MSSFRNISDRLCVFLRSATIGQLVTYGEINQVAGINVQLQRGPLYRSLKLLLNDGFCFDVIRDKGLQRANDHEKVLQATDHLRSLGRKAKKVVAVAQSVDSFAELTKDDQLRHNAAIAIAGSIRKMCQTKALKMVEEVINNQSNLEITIEQTLKLFSK